MSALTIQSAKRLLTETTENEGYVKIYEVGAGTNFADCSIRMARIGDVDTGLSVISLLTKKSNVAISASLDLPAFTPYNDVSLDGPENTVSFVKVLLGAGEELWAKTVGLPVALNASIFEQNNLAVEACGTLGALTNASVSTTYDLVNLQPNPNAKYATMSLSIQNPSATTVADVYVYLSSATAPITDADIIEHRKMTPLETVNIEGIVLNGSQRLSVKSSVPHTEFNANGIIHKAV